MASKQVIESQLDELRAEARLLNADFKSVEPLQREIDRRTKLIEQLMEEVRKHDRVRAAYLDRIAAIADGRAATRSAELKRLIAAKLKALATEEKRTLINRLKRLTSELD